MVSGYTQKNKAVALNKIHFKIKEYIFKQVCLITSTITALTDFRSFLLEAILDTNLSISTEATVIF